jgi:hypothetical protein
MNKVFMGAVFFLLSSCTSVPRFPDISLVQEKNLVKNAANIMITENEDAGKNESLIVLGADDQVILLSIDNSRLGLCLPLIYEKLKAPTGARIVINRSAIPFYRFISNKHHNKKYSWELFKSSQKAENYSELVGLLSGDHEDKTTFNLIGKIQENVIIFNNDGLGREYLVNSNNLFASVEIKHNKAKIIKSAEMIKVIEDSGNGSIISISSLCESIEF